MRSIMLLILLTGTCALSAQFRIKVYYERTSDGYEVFADNDEYGPVTLQLEFDLTNLRTDGKDNIEFVVPPKSERNLVAEFQIAKPGKAAGLSFGTRANYGDHTVRDYDEEFVYHLPYARGEGYAIWQGYNGSFSHKGIYAIDFSMPPGTEIHAARPGIVFKVVESNSRHCPQPECAKYNNYILIWHSDGTFAEYGHIQKDGAIVSEGDEVAIDQLLGYSGNVGWATGPHLHFSVFLPEMLRQNSVKTLFLLEEGAKPGYLEEKKTYRRNYE